MDEQVTISKKLFDELMDAKTWLDALEAAGVDNWCGYDEARSILEEWEGESDNE